MNLYFDGLNADAIVNALGAVLAVSASMMLLVSFMLQASLSRKMLLY
jgi:hypothetical protein